MPRVSKPKLLWDNNLTERYQNYDGDEEEMDKIWEDIYQERQYEFDNLLECTDKFVNGTIYLIGTIQMNGQGFPVSRSLKTDNLSDAIEKATSFLNKDASIKIMIAENELVISQLCYDGFDIPSVFSFRSVPDTARDIKDPDELLEHSASIAPLVRRVTKNCKCALTL